MTGGQKWMAIGRWSSWFSCLRSNLLEQSISFLCGAYLPPFNSKWISSSSSALYRLPACPTQFTERPRVDPGMSWACIPFQWPMLTLGIFHSSSFSYVIFYLVIVTMLCSIMLPPHPPFSKWLILWAPPKILLPSISTLLYSFSFPK